MWNAEKINKQVSSGQVFVWVRFTQSDTGEFFEPEPYRSTAPVKDWPDEAINARLKELNSFDHSTVKLGVPEASKAEDAGLDPE